MKHPLFAAMLAVSTLSGCATVLTPDRCETALTGLGTAQDIVAVLIARGVQPEIAAKIAQALAVGQITLGTACASVNPQ